MRKVRTILRPSSGLSITAAPFSSMDGGKKVSSQWPPVAPMASAEAMIRGPVMKPSSIASRRPTSA